MSDYYDVQGRPIDQATWGRLFSQRTHVGLTWVNGYTISTVWLGLDHSFGTGPPLIFETMVFGLDEDSEYMERFSTLTEARKGHNDAIEWASNRTPGNSPSQP